MDKRWLNSLTFIAAIIAVLSGHVNGDENISTTITAASFKFSDVNGDEHTSTTTTTNAPFKFTDESVQPFLIIPIALGVVAFLVAVAIVTGLVCCVKRRRQMREDIELTPITDNLPV